MIVSISPAFMSDYRGNVGMIDRHTTEDTLVLDGEVYTIKPTELPNLPQTDSVTDITLHTSCIACRKDRNLEFSDGFPTEISFECHSCGRKNDIYTGHNYSGISDEQTLNIGNALHEHVKNRELQLLGESKADGNGTSAIEKQLVREIGIIEWAEKTVSRLRIAFVAIVITTVGVAFLDLFVTHPLLFSLFQVGAGAIITLGFVVACVSYYQKRVTETTSVAELEQSLSVDTDNLDKYDLEQVLSGLRREKTTDE